MHTDWKKKQINKHIFAVPEKCRSTVRAEDFMQKQQSGTVRMLTLGSEDANAQQQLSEENVIVFYSC